MEHPSAATETLPTALQATVNSSSLGDHKETQLSSTSQLLWMILPPNGLLWDSQMISSWLENIFPFAH